MPGQSRCSMSCARRMQLECPHECRTMLGKAAGDGEIYKVKWLHGSSPPGDGPLVPLAHGGRAGGRSGSTALLRARWGRPLSVSTSVSHRLLACRRICSDHSHSCYDTATHNIWPPRPSGLLRSFAAVQFRINRPLTSCPSLYYLSPSLPADGDLVIHHCDASSDDRVRFEA